MNNNIKEKINESICWICSKNLKYAYIRNNRHFGICDSCGLINVYEGLVKDNKGNSIYSDGEELFTQDGNINYYLDETHLLSFSKKLFWVKKFLPKGAKILDIGANFGHFLHVVQNEYDATGLEISKYAVKWSIEKFKVHNYVGDIFSPPKNIGKNYDAITLWDVLEHLEESNNAIEKINSMLKEGGYLFLTTPDSKSLVARCLGRKWYYLDPIQHINIFNMKNINILLNRHGFEIISKGKIGHYYCIKYIFDRIIFLTNNNIIKKILIILKFILKPFLNKSIYIKLGDVMIITAKKIKGKDNETIS